MGTVRLVAFAWSMMATVALAATAPTATKLQVALDRAIAAGDARFTVPPGEYAFNASNFEVAMASSMVVDATGATMWFAPG